jgi:protein-S-isoprenylcysteine O-methyltransferase Ste14
MKMAPPLTPGRLLAKLATAILLLALALLVPAGTWRWPAAWAYLGLYLAFAVPVGVWLQRTNPGLLADRVDWSRRAPKAWDRVLLALLIPAFVAVYVTAGLDFRFGWSDLAAPLRGACFLLVGAFYGLMFLVLRENAFLSRVVEVRPEQGHRVVTTGPYAVVRHPMYAGYVVWILAAPLALGSLPALAPAGLIAVGVVVRTVLEDRTLRAELPGYADYAARVRWRLVPGLF